MSRVATVPAQAKINLVLRILAREESGYHQIETLFCRLALADTVTVRVTQSGRDLRCTGDSVPPDGLGQPERNLAWRAASAYATATGFPSGFAIDIGKRIPVGGGLGGGSADAGAVLRALNALNASPVPAATLLGIARSLGADVPFLTQADSPLALAWGRGDRMVTLPALPERAVSLFVPEVPVATAEAYSWLDERPLSPGAEAPIFADLSSWEAVAQLAGNDFEEPVAEHVPVVRRLLDGLRRQAADEVPGSPAIVRMSGSGSTVFRIASAESGPGVNLGETGAAGFRVIRTMTSTFVEPVVLTH